MNKTLSDLMLAMADHDKGYAGLVQHFTKVHNFSAAIGAAEGLDETTQMTLEAAALVHDVGILPSRAKYGSSMGKYQEIEGPPVAEQLLRQVGGFTEAQIDRVKYLVGHHHTYDCIEGIDYQILIEADFLVNLFENGQKYEDAMVVREKYFKTKAGTALLEAMFLSEQK